MEEQHGSKETSVARTELDGGGEREEDGVREVMRTRSRPLRAVERSWLPRRVRRARVGF